MSARHTEDWVKLIPEQLHDYLLVFSKEKAKELPLHRKEWDCPLDLVVSNTYQFKKAPAYSLSEMKQEEERK